MTLKRPRTLGLDPGLARLGWAVIDAVGQDSVLVEAGLLTTPSRRPTPERLHTLADGVKTILKKYRPDTMAIEQVFFTRNVSTALQTSQVRGAVLLIAAEAGLPVVEFTPTAVKLAVTGDGRADKIQIHRMVKLLLRLKHAPNNDDTTDAMAIALCGANTRNYS